MLRNNLKDLFTFSYRTIAFVHWHVWECFLQCCSNSRKRAPEKSFLILITRLTSRITRTKHTKQWKLCQLCFVRVLQQIHSSCKQRDISLCPTEIPRLLTSPALDAYKSLAPPKAGWDLDKMITLSIWTILKENGCFCDDYETYCEPPSLFVAVAVLRSFWLDLICRNAVLRCVKHPAWRSISCKLYIFWRISWYLPLDKSFCQNIL